MRIYVAHSIENMKWVKDNVFPKLHGFEIEDPFGSQRQILSGRSESDLRSDVRVKELYSAKWVVSHDKHQIERSDGMLVIRHGGDAYGSVFEIVYMAMVLERPVFFVDLRGSPIYHPWLAHYCECITDDLDLAIESLHVWFDSENDI